MKKYQKAWLALVKIIPQPGYSMKDVTDSEDIIDDNQTPIPIDQYVGAWANVIIKGQTMEEVLKIIPKGFTEKNFDVKFIDKIENIELLIETEELNEDTKEEIDWLLDSNYDFKISGRIFPFVDEEL